MTTAGSARGADAAQAELRLRLVRDRLGLWWWTLEDEAGAPSAAAREGFTDVRASCRALAEHIRAREAAPPRQREKTVIG